MKILGILTVLLSFATALNAQTVNADRVRLATGPCFLESQAGTPISLVLTGTCTGITTTSPNNLTLNPSGDLVTDPVGNDVLPNLPYDINIGMLSKKYLTLHAAELWVETLVAQNTIATIGGRVLVAPTNILVVDLAPASTTISVKYNNFFNGDRIYLESDAKVEFMAVTSGASGSGPYAYTVTRDLDGSGANQWYAGDAMLNTGTVGNGFIDLYSVSGVLSSGVGPSIVGNVRTGTTYSAYAPRWAIGNLNGLYGYASSIYGTAFGDPAATNVTVDATNGFRIRSGATNKFAADVAGNLAMDGNLTVGTGGIIHSAGASSYTTGTGFWIAGGATPVFRVGNPAGNQMAWDGATLSISANGSGLTNIDGNNITTGTISAGSINATGFGNNLVKNGNFEGVSQTAGLTGWAADDYTNPTITHSGANGAVGPGYMSIEPGSAFYGSVTYLAAPVRAGQTYRIRFFARVPTTTSDGFYARLLESTTNTTGVRRVTAAPATAPDVNDTSSTAVISNGALTTSWQQFSFTYTVPASVTWISAHFLNFTGPSAGVYSHIEIDGVELELQIGSGHIAANSITASNIAAGTITATEIAANTITASKLNVTTLSSITANIGSITSGSLSIGGNFSVDSSGNLQANNASFSGTTATGSIVMTGGMSMTGNLTANGTIRFDNLSGAGTAYVCASSNGTLSRAASC